MHFHRLLCNKTVSKLHKQYETGVSNITVFE